VDLQSIIEGVRSNGEILIVGLVNKTMSNPRVTTSIVKAMEASISFKAAVDKNLQFAYKSMNITSRADFDNLARNVFLGRWGWIAHGWTARADQLAAACRFARALSALLDLPAEECDD